MQFAPRPLCDVDCVKGLFVPASQLAFSAEKSKVKTNSYFFNSILEC
jgi:hypothetical protein